MKEDKRIPQPGECMEYIGLNSESCKRADRYDRMEALRQSNHKYSVNQARYVQSMYLDVSLMDIGYVSRK